MLLPMMRALLLGAPRERKEAGHSTAAAGDGPDESRHAGHPGAATGARRGLLRRHNGLRLRRSRAPQGLQHRQVAGRPALCLHGRPGAFGLPGQVRGAGLPMVRRPAAQGSRTPRPAVLLSASLPQRQPEPQRRAAAGSDPFRRPSAASTSPTPRPARRSGRARSAASAPPDSRSSRCRRAPGATRRWSTPRRTGGCPSSW